MTRKVWIALLLVAMVGGGGYYLHDAFFARGATPSAAPGKGEPRQVKVIVPKRIDRTAPLVLSARIEPVEQASIFARANGFVEERKADIGDTVKSGQLLARLSSPELEEGIKQVKADIARQEAVVILAKKMLARAEALHESGAVSKSEYDERQSEHRVAVATGTALQAKLEQLQSEYAYTRILAPFSGRVTVRNIERGDRISSTDAKPLFRLVRDDSLRVVVDIPQTWIYALDTAGTATLSLPEIPDKAFPVTYSRAAQEMDASTGTMRVEYLLDNRSHKLPAGLSAEVGIHPSKDAHVLSVPDNTVRVFDGKTSVLTLDDQNRVSPRQIVAGRYTGSTIEVQSGLKPTDRVILNPNALLKAGDVVTVAEEAPPAAPDRAPTANPAASGAAAPSPRTVAEKEK